MKENPPEIAYSMTYREAVRLLELVDQSPHCASLDLQFGDLKLSLSRRAGAASAVPTPPPAPDAEPAPAPVRVDAPAAPAQSPAPSAPPSAGEDEAGITTIRSPMLGTFYRSPSPGEPAFTQPGQTVGAGDTIGLIEVMKLFTPMTTGVEGEIVDFLVENGALVEYDQPVLRLRAR